jgi:hypothetical protein
MKSKSVAAGIQNAEHEVAESEVAQAQLSNAPSLEKIRQLAYDIHVERGGTHGQDLDDWLRAERELEAKYRAG